MSDMHEINIVWDADRLTIRDLSDIYRADFFAATCCDIGWDLDGMEYLVMDDDHYRELKEIIERIRERRGEGSVDIRHYEEDDE